MLRKNNTVDKYSLVKIISQQLGLSEKVNLTVINSLIKEILIELKENKKIVFKNFCSLIVLDKRARIGRNPITLEEHNISARKSIKVKISDNYNKKLSEKRAKSVVKWLVNQRINKERLVAKGFGETQLINKCSNGVECTEKEHQINRRVEFVILNPETIKK